MRVAQREVRPTQGETAPLPAAHRSPLVAARARALLHLQRLAGNLAVSRLLTVQRDDDQALLEREDRAIAALRGRQGASAGTFTYGNPSSPDYRPPKEPPTATLTLGDLALRPTSDTQKRRSFDSQPAAEAYATIAVGPAGAAVASQDGLWFVFGLASASASELKRENVYRCAPAAPVASVMGTDRILFTARSYTPDTGQAALDPRAEDSLAKPSDAAALRDLAGMGPDPAGGPRKPGTAIPAEQAEAFIRSYFQARALETLDQNRKLALDLTKKFTQKDGKVGGAAKELMDKSRELGARYQELEDKEAVVGETALIIDQKHQQGRWNLITAKGRTQKYHQWIDEINGQLQGIDKGKAEVLALSPMLAALVQHEATPRTAGDWATKLGWERSALRRGVRAASPIATGLFDWVEKKMQAAPSWKDSDLSKPATEEGDLKIAEDFRVKVDNVHKALSKAYAKVAGGDVDDLLSMGGLRARVEADVRRMGPENKAVKDKYQEMVLNKELKDAAIEAGGTVLSLAALLLPGGQFISAAIGLGMSMQTMSEHLGQWDTAQASVDPSKALVDQQELSKQLLFDTMALALSAVEVASEVKGGMEALEQGRVPKGPKDADAPGSPGTPGAPGVPGKAGGRTIPDAVADTAHDSHVHVTADGHCLVCFSPCDDARATFGAEIRENPGLGGELSAVEREAAQAGAAVDPAPALEAVKPKAVAVETRLYDAAIAARVKRVAGWLPSLYERYPILARLPLGEDAIGRVVAKWRNFNSLKGQLFEELTAQKVLKMMDTAEGRTALGARPGEKLELIPGHQVREHYMNSKGQWAVSQFSDGLVVVRNPDGTIDRVVTVIEAKSGTFSSEKLAAETEGMKRLSSKGAKDRRAEAIEEFRDRHRGDPETAGLSIEEIDEKYKSDIGDIAKELNQREGQVSRDLERIDQAQIQELRNGEWIDIPKGRAGGKPQVFGVVPDDIDAKALTKDINKTDPHVPFKAENIGKDLDSDAVNTIAGQIRRQAQIPAAPGVR
jgi:hypothetical protein